MSGFSLQLKKIAVEKQRRARMNRSLAALRDLLQGEVGEVSASLMYLGT